jgi:hypothetical protein
MSIREVSITGRNNVRAQVTGQEELLTKVNSISSGVNVPVTITSPIGQEAMADSVAVVIASDQSSIPVNDDGGSLTVDAVSFDIRPLDCATDSVSICSDGTPVGSANPLPVDITLPTSIDVNVNDGVSNPITSTTIVGSTGLDVNIIQTNVPNSLDNLVQTGVTGDLSAFGSNITSISFVSVGTAAALVSVNGGSTYFSAAPGTTINLSADGPTGFYSGTSFYWDTLTNAGASLIIIYNYI